MLCILPKFKHIFINTFSKNAYIYHCNLVYIYIYIERERETDLLWILLTLQHSFISMFPQNAYIYLCKFSSTSSCRVWAIFHWVSLESYVNSPISLWRQISCYIPRMYIDEHVHASSYAYKVAVYLWIYEHSPQSCSYMVCLHCNHRRKN